MYDIHTQNISNARMAAGLSVKVIRGKGPIFSTIGLADIWELFPTAMLVTNKATRDVHCFNFNGYAGIMQLKISTRTSI